MIEHTYTNLNGSFDLKNLDAIAAATREYEGKVFRFVSAIKTDFERASKNESVKACLEKVFFTEYVAEVEKSISVFESILNKEYTYDEILHVYNILPNFNAIKDVTRLIKINENINSDIAAKTKSILNRIHNIDKKARKVFRIVD